MTPPMWARVLNAAWDELLHDGCEHICPACSTFFERLGRTLEAMGGFDA